MKIYMIRAKDRGQKVFDYMPELTASEWAAKERKKLLEKDFDVTIDEFEVKTQGSNFHSISQTSKIIKIG